MVNKMLVAVRDANQVKTFSFRLNSVITYIQNFANILYYREFHSVEPFLKYKLGL